MEKRYEHKNSRFAAFFVMFVMINSPHKSSPAKNSRDAAKNHTGRVKLISIGKGIEDLTFKEEGQHPSGKQGMDEDRQFSFIQVYVESLLRSVCQFVTP